MKSHSGKAILKKSTISRTKKFSREYSPSKNQTKSPESLLRPANEKYKKASILLKSAFAAKGRLDLTKGKKSFDDTKKKYGVIAKEYCEDVWRDYCELNNLTYNSKFDLPNSFLTKKGKVIPNMAKLLLEHFSEDFDIIDDLPHMPDNNLIKNLITAPKTVIAQQCINGMTEFRHSRPCVILRQLLECEVNGSKYLLINDIKFYQNSPVIASPLIVLRNGYKKGACLISRIDEIGMLSPEDYSHYKEIYQKQHPRTKLTDPIYPRYLLEKFEESHQNTRNLTNNKFFKSEDTASQTRHIHKANEEFFMLNALAVLESSYNFSKTKKTDKVFKAFNAQNIQLEDYTDRSSHEDIIRKTEDKHVYNGIEAVKNYFDEMTQSQFHVDEFVIDKVMPNGGLISTEDIIKLINKFYNTNYTPDKKLVETLDEVRMFKPLRKIRYIDSSLLPPLDKSAPSVSTKLTNKLELYVRKNTQFGSYIDDEYLKTHIDELNIEESAPASTLKNNAQTKKK